MSQGSEAAEPASFGVTEQPFSLEAKHKKGGITQLPGLPLRPDLSAGSETRSWGTGTASSTHSRAPVNSAKAGPGPQVCLALVSGLSREPASGFGSWSSNRSPVQLTLLRPLGAAAP